MSFTNIKNTIFVLSIGILSLFCLFINTMVYAQSLVEIKQKKQMVEQMVRDSKMPGVPLPRNLAVEVKKAKKAEKSGNWNELERSLDRIISMIKQPEQKMDYGRSQSEKELLSGAQERIEKHRMGDADILVVSVDGRPLKLANVTIKQTRHAFLFGTSLSDPMWAAVAAWKYGYHSKMSRKFSVSSEQINECLKKMDQFANYTFLPVGWEVYEPQKGKIQYKVYDGELEYFKERGYKILAHHIVWNNFTPNWLPSDTDQLWNLVKQRVENFASHYKEKFDYFLVFNEPADPFRDQFKKDPLTKVFKEKGKVNFVSMPFKIFRENYPSAKLMINEVAIKKGKGFPKLLNELKDNKGKPLYDVIGIQTHMHRKLWKLTGIWKACEYYSQFGVPLHFTEVTVLSGNPISGDRFGKSNTRGGEEIQADYVSKLYTLLFSHPGVEAITWWSISDLYAWKGAPAGLLRKDMSSKPSYLALIDLIKNKWWTRLHTKTSGQGQFNFKGFYGDYEITITMKDGSEKKFKIQLKKDGKRSFKLII